MALPFEQTDEQRKRTFEAAGLPVPNSITSKDLEDTSDINFKTPEPQSTETASSLGTPEPPLPKSEAEFETGRTRLDELNRFLSGESAFRAEQEQTSGFTEAQQTFDDLSQRLRDLQRQESAIPLQVQQEFEGRGATVGGIRPIEAGRLRENAIEALTVSALIDASQNRLTSAQRKVDRAIEAQFGAATAEKKAILENLNLITQSPRTTREEKERAEAQKAKQEAEKTKLEEQKELRKDILNFANSVASQLARLPNGSVLLDKIQKSGSMEEAQKIAFDAGVSQQDLTGLDQDYRTLERILGRNPTQQELLNYKQQQFKGSPTKPINKDILASRLNAVGLNPAFITDEGELTKSNADKIAAKGVPPSIVDLITQSILEGNTLEDIRQALKEGYGQDTGFGYLDKYMSTLQEKEEIENPFK